MLAREELDLVCIVTPDDAHAGAGAGRGGHRNAHRLRKTAGADSDAEAWELTRLVEDCRSGQPGRVHRALFPGHDRIA